MLKLSNENIQKMNAWYETKDLNQYAGAIGGRFTSAYRLHKNKTEVIIEDSLEHNSLSVFEDQHFSLDAEDEIKINQWLKDKNNQKEKDITYMITHTSLGSVIKIQDNNDQTILDLTDYDAW